MIDDPPIDALEEPVAPPNGAGAAGGDGWRLDSNGKEFIPAQGRRGRIMRQGQETVDEALARDAAPKPPPRPKRRKPKIPEPPRGVDLKALERELEEALKAPGALCLAIGEEWPAEHFIVSAKPLARNLVLAADHNPWLRRQLEEIATGQQAFGKIISLFSVAGALFMYAVPPVVYFLNLPVSPKGRVLLGGGSPIPYRGHPPGAPSPAPAPTPGA